MNSQNKPHKYNIYASYNNLHKLFSCQAEFDPFSIADKAVSTPRSGTDWPDSLLDFEMRKECVRIPHQKKT